MRAGMSFSLLLLLPRRSLAAFVAPPAHTLIERAGVRHGGRRAERAARCAADTLEGGKRQRTRFAPSPTGSLHVGGARTALFSWLRARQDDGDFIIRVEDTDTARSTRESEASVLQDLRWLGLLWDEGPEVGGEKGPYRQSERMGSGLYQELADRLMKEGHAYPCFCTAEELDLKRKAAEAAGENPQYDGTWRDADPAEVQKRLDAGEPYTVRFKVPRGKKITISDLVRGEVTWDVQATVGDFILLRSAEGTAEAAGMPVYNFCVAVDDALMDVTTVIRAEEHLTNTVRQILILEALGYDVPKYAHLSLVLGEDRSKLSKRHGATSVDQFRKEGFLPEAMVNYLCLLGWNDDTEQDIYSVGELTDAFSLDRVTKSPAVFDMKKLRWVNGQHLRALPPDEFAALLAPQLHELGVTTAADVTPFVHAASAMVAEKVELLNDAAPLITAAMDFPLAETIKSLPFSDATLNLHAVGNAVVDAYRAGTFPDPAADGFDAAWKAWAKGVGKQLGVKGKGLFLPLRVAATGSLSGPDIPAQLRTVALAGGQVACPVVPLADRIDQLEAALSTMAPAPPKVDTAALDEKLGLLARARDGGALSESIYDKAKRDLEK